MANFPGWSNNNQSSPLGTTGWIQGNETDVFVSQQGASDAFLAANFNNTSGSTVQEPFVTFKSCLIMIWVKCPYYTRSTIAMDGVTIYPDRLRVRYSSTGGVAVGD